MPYSDDLKEKFKNEPVSFIYLTIDRDMDKWKNAIKTMGVNGENYMLDGALKSSFAKYFNIHGVPHYILINKKGEVILPSAPRPSSVGVESSIKTLCEE